MKLFALIVMSFMLTACPEKDDASAVSETKENSQIQEKEITKQPVLKVCTKELKICPDGSGVGRNSEKNCEFDDCPKPVVVKKGEPIMCTQEVKQCPDGSFVGRDSNKQCAFKPCPKDASNLQ